MLKRSLSSALFLISTLGLIASKSPAQVASPAQVESPQPAETGTTITVGRGVIVPVLVTREVRVGAAGASQEEHKVKFAVDQDVIYQGYVIAKAGDLAEGHYDTQTNQTKRQFETTTSQEVDFYLDDVVNFCGDTIHVEFEKAFVGGIRSGFLSFGVHAHDAVVGKGDVLEASTDRAEKNICAQPSTEMPKPLPKNVIAPDPQLTP
ncbi:MAG: hypothetical protein WAK84_12295, partial [Candidatus Cybelea sp.]